MRGSYLMPVDPKGEGLHGAPGQADLVDIHYDEAINMYYHEYKSNMEKYAKNAEDLHKTLSGLAFALIKFGASANIWNPIGWALTAVAAVIAILNEFEVFKEKSAWDAKRGKDAYNVMSKYYEEAIVGKEVGKDKEGRIMYSGGLKDIEAVTCINDELIQGLLNDIYFNLCIYDHIFEKIKNSDWKSSESEATTRELSRIAKTLKEGFRGKIESYKRVYNITWSSATVNLSDSVFDERWNTLQLTQSPIGFGDRNIVIEFPILILKRKDEYIGMAVPFVDFLNSAETKASAFEKAFDNDKKGLFKTGDDIFFNFETAALCTSNERAKREYDQWLKKAEAYEKAVYFNSWNAPYNQKIHRVTEPMHADNQCRNMGLVLSDFIDKRGEYKNATAQDLLKLLKAAKARHNKFNIPGKGVVAPNCHQLSARDMPKVLTAFKAFGLNPNDYDDNFDFRKIASLPSPSDPSGQSSNFTQNSGLITPDGYTDEHPYNPLRREPARPSPPNQGQNQGQSQETKPSTPALQPQANPQATPEPAPSTPGGDKKKSLWWIWLLVAAGGLYMITKKEKKNGN